MFRQPNGSKPQLPTGPSQPLPPCQLDSRTGRFVWTASWTRALTLSGVGAGILSGLLGVGGGFVIVPALKKATNAPLHAIVATSLAVISLVSASGVISTAIAVRMNWQVGVPFAAGTMIAMLAAWRIASRLSGHRLQQGVALVSGLIAIGMAVNVALAA
ncbi:sulfite exporter TauE/SafE family protein [Cupriavidus sp. IDO]|uniref:sulfite exporter TauE/SafE family protein n=1 Tax=Cupriavidus sp. IDO TaxID=1539142 RepID=UPI003083E4C7